MRWLSPLSALLLLGLLVNSACAQAPAPGAGPQTPQSTAVRSDAQRRSYYGTVRQPSRYPSRYDDSRYAGYRNPGGVGRFAEYYPAGDHFQNDVGRNPVPVATFNGGSGVPTMDEQMAAQQLGVAKYNSIQQSIDRYAHPFYGYGFGGFY
ncbi:MAG: hypothetical protein P4L84_02685 [Isosphaeraceae bacterium]|nr:hypothetical protein [Isosphaeraceae bacterium]